MAELHERALGGVAQSLPVRNFGYIGRFSSLEHKRGLVAHCGHALQPLELLVILVKL